MAYYQRIPPEVCVMRLLKLKLAVESWYDLRHFNQSHDCAIYRRKRLHHTVRLYYTGSHLRQWDLPGEEQST